MDVLSRFEGAAQESEATTIVRLTADCPLSDPEVIDHVITKYLEQPNACKFATNAIPRSYPAGLEVECFSRDALKVASMEGSASSLRNSGRDTTVICRRQKSLM